MQARDDVRKMDDDVDNFEGKFTSITRIAEVEHDKIYRGKG